MTLLFFWSGLFPLVASNILVLSDMLFWHPCSGGRFPSELQTNVIFLLTLQLFFYLLLFAYIYIFVTFYYKSPFSERTQLRRRKLSAHNAVRYLLGGIALSMIIMIIPPFST